MKVGVVLGGGGPLGTAWYAGLGEGLAEVGFDLGEADVFIGTSAGAIAGCWWASGQPVSALTSSVIRRFESADVDAAAAPINLELIGQIYRRFEQATEPLEESVSKQIGDLARSVPARNGDEDWNVTACAPHMPAAWPARFQAVVVRARDGKVQLIGSADALSVPRGVAASCAAPGIVRPVRIGNDLYMDGGARSPTNADLATAFGLERCLVICPIPPDTPLMGAVVARLLEEEIRRLRNHGTAVAVIAASERESSAFGANLLDTTRAHEAIAIGKERGHQTGSKLSYV